MKGVFYFWGFVKKILFLSILAVDWSKGEDSCGR
jgi:hypothetical protein